MTDLIPQSFVVRTSQDVALADDLLLDLYRKRDLAEEKRKEVSETQRAAMETAIAPWREAVQGYNDAISMLKSALKVYREITQEAESRAAQAYLAGGAAPVPSVQSKTTTVKKVLRWRVTGKLEAKFMQPNEGMINAYVKAGKVPAGVEVYEEDVIVKKGGVK